MERATHTLIFVDVDGVVNVGLRDQDRAPLLLNEACLDVVRKCDTPEALEALGDSAARVLSAADRVPDRVAPASADTAPLLVARLAKVLQAAAGQSRVVLSSNWRLPRHTKRVESLEQELSSYIGERFKFDARTEVLREAGPGDRLRCIGKYVNFYCAVNGVEELRVLVIDDFFVRALDGWDVAGSCNTHVSSAADAEEYLRRCAPEGTQVEVKLVYCYEEWEAENGVQVQAGIGLTEAQVQDARRFLGASHAEPALDKSSKELDAARSLAKLAMCWAGVVSMSPAISCIQDV